ncbi:nitroreductase family protein [uncultured Bacteroides sp.]|uniref:nitroreductase family protein n=1 Tax=uncultured Bacteroides sp. TaxID=162156 RepID=UPI002AA7FD42|nr:nitroreductase family protein [uncultured Bacteroides sp.]
MKKIYAITMIAIFMASCKAPQKTETMKVKNETVATIMNRRSIRAYLPEQIKPEQLDTIMQCAINAPSAMNKQSWEVRVIRKPELIKAINEGYMAYAKVKDSEKAGFSVFHGAPTVIIVASNVTNDYSPVDCGLLGQNILLSAESMNIGTCVIGSVIGYLNAPEAKDLVAQLNLPANYKPLYAVSIGYKNERPEAKPRDNAKVQVIK